MSLAPDLVLAVLLLLTGAAATRPAAVLSRQRAVYRGLPEPIERRFQELRRTTATATVLGSALIAAYLVKWPVPAWLLILGGLYWLQASAVATVIWWETAAAAAPVPADWSQTPYDGIMLSATTPADAGAGAKIFDVFLSYKSEDVHVVRAVADRLIAAGLRVWFAEYIVLLVARDLFQRAIDNGIRRSSFGVVFTNDRFIGSSHCCHELDALLAPDGPGARSLIEVRIPHEPCPHQYQPTLAECRAMEYRADPEQVVRFILESFDLRATLPRHVPPGSGAPVQFRHEQWGYTLDATGWEVDRRAPVPAGEPAYRRTVDGHVLKVNLHVGTGTVAPRPVTAVLDDRDVFDRSVEFANSFISQTKQRCVGAHLFFLGGYSHLVAVYWHARCWTRRYSIVLPDPKTGESTEFAFAFGFFGSFTDYCGAVPLMDRLVESLTWSGRLAGARPAVAAEPPPTPARVSCEGLAPFSYVRPAGWTLVHEVPRRGSYAAILAPAGEPQPRGFLSALRVSSRLDLLVSRYDRDTIDDEERFKRATYYNVRQQQGQVMSDCVTSERGVLVHECIYRRGARWSLVVRFIERGNEFVVCWTSRDMETFRQHVPAVQEFAKTLTV